MSELSTLFSRNKKWHKHIDEEFFVEHAKGQNPPILFIACADSRVTPSEITQSKLGQLFEMRNVANIVAPDDASMQAIVRYAVTHLHVQHIIVCGHYGCGGVKAAMDIAEQDAQPEHELSTWLAPIVDLYKKNQDVLASITDDVERYKKLIQLNVMAQIDNLKQVDSIIEANEETELHQAPKLHGAIYDIHTGQIQLVGHDQVAIKNELDESVIREQLLRLSLYAKSFNPFNWLGAQSKHDKIEQALQTILETGKNISCELQNHESELYQALNQKRLISFSFMGFNKNTWFNNKAEALITAEEECSSFLAEDLQCKL